MRARELKPHVVPDADSVEASRTMRKVLARLFPGRPALAQFAWDTEARRTGREALEDAGLASAAGLAIDRAQLEEMTGYTLVEDATEAGISGVHGLPGLPGTLPPAQNARKPVANPLQNARKGSDGDLPPPGETPALERFFEAFRADMDPAAVELERILALPEAERPAAARELMGRLDELLPSDPAMAAALAEEMARAFAEGANDELRVKSDGRREETRDEHTSRKGERRRRDLGAAGAMGQVPE